MPDEAVTATRRETMMRLLGLGAIGTATGGLGLWLRSRSRRPEPVSAAGIRRNHTVPADPARPEMVIVRGDDPRELVRRVLEPLGGIQRFISRGDIVVVKPNMAWDRAPEFAANTNPEVVGAVVQLCREAGAARVVVTDVSTHDARSVYMRSGIAETARSSGAEIIFPAERRFREINLHGEILTDWPVFEPFLEADKIINIPIAKQHSLTGATLGMKNWYGILGGQRHRLHQRIHEVLADLAGFMRPTLTILDAYRVLIRNGPVGGSLADVELHKTLAAGTDPIAIDTWAARKFWEITPEGMRCLRLAEERGLGSTDLQKVRTLTLDGARG